LIENRQVGGRQRGALDVGPPAAEAGASFTGRLSGVQQGVSADKHALNLHHVVPPFDPVLDPTGNRVLGGKMEAVLVTETVEAAPLPATTELSLHTHNWNQLTTTLPERTEEENETHHHTVEPCNVPILPQLLEGRNGKAIGLKGRTSKFLGPNLLL
jgi:hypothetical protein